MPASGPYSAQIERAIAALLRGDNDWGGSNMFNDIVFPSAGFTPSVTAHTLYTTDGTTLYWNGSAVGGGGSGTVTSVSVTTANGISGTVATATTTPAITLALGTIAPVGTITSADATTPILATASGKTNTGYLSLTGKTSGSLKILPADAMAQIVTIAPAAQTVGAATLTIPDRAGVSGTFAFTDAVIAPAQGGTGVANNAASTLAISGNFATTLTVTGATGVTLPTTGTLATWAGTETLTNKRITKRVGTTTSSATPTINTDNYDEYGLTAQSGDITSFTTNLTGTPNDGDVLTIRITGTAARAITWGAKFAGGDVALPTTTTTTKTLVTSFKIIAAVSTTVWQCMASTNVGA